MNFAYISTILYSVHCSLPGADCSAANPNAESALVRLSFASAKIVLPRGTHLALSQLKNGTVGP
jgi:hypothetical protein